MAVQSIVQDADQAGVPISEAAARLGITAEAVRKRIRRRTLRAYKMAGHWYVVLPKSKTTEQDASRTIILDGIPDDDLDAGMAGNRDAGRTVLITALQDEIAFLRRELDHRTDELRRRDEIIAMLVQRTQEPPTPPVVATQAVPVPTRRPTQPPGVIAQWLRRLLG